VHQVISKFTEIKTSKIQMEPALAQLHYEENVLKATGHVDNRNLSAEEDKWYNNDEQESSEKSDDEQEKSEKNDEFKKIEHPGSQEEECSVIVDIAEA
jgi:hypothetical protein